MSDGRLPAELEVGSLLRRVQAEGGFATVIKRGDPESGALLLIVTSRGREVAWLERALTGAGTYSWQVVGPGESTSSADLQAFLAKRTRFDADMWAIELDIAEPERFIAETTGSG